MADNVAITAGTGTTVAADEVVDGTLGTVKVQYVKLMDGTLDGTAKAAVGTNGLKVDGSAVTQPVSGSLTTVSTVTNLSQMAGAAISMGTGVRGAGVQRVTIATDDVVPASQSGTWTVQPGNTANTTAWKVDGSAVTQPVSLASVPSHAVTNAGTFAVQPDTSVAQGSTTSGQKGALALGAVTTSSPTYTTAQSSPLSLDTAGNLRVNVVAGGASGGTSSTVGAAVPSTATAVGFTDGTNMVLAKVKATTGAAATTDPALVVTLRDVNANGSAADSASAPIAFSTEGKAQLGSVTETAPASDTASSGLNGRLQRVAQRLTSILAAFSPTATANGATSSRVNSAASTNATSLKASAGQGYEIDVFNNAAYNVFLKFYNKASAPTVGTDTPIWTIPIQAGGGYSKSFRYGKTFSTGIAYAITKLQADSDTTVVAAGDLTGSIDWI